MSLKKPPSRALLALREAFPLAFPADDAALRPLAIGIREPILAWTATRPEVNVKQVHAALAYHCTRITYRRLLIEGATRINLQGAPVGVVTAAAAQLARVSVEQDRAAAATKALARAQQLERHAAAQAKLPAAAKPAKQPTTAVVQVAAPPVAAPSKRPTVVVKKRRSISGP